MLAMLKHLACVLRGGHYPATTYECDGGPVRIKDQCILCGWEKWR